MVICPDFLYITNVISKLFHLINTYETEIGPGCLLSCKIFGPKVKHNFKSKMNIELHSVLSNLCVVQRQCKQNIFSREWFYWCVSSNASTYVFVFDSMYIKLVDWLDFLMIKIQLNTDIIYEFVLSLIKLNCIWTTSGYFCHSW